MPTRLAGLSTTLEARLAIARRVALGIEKRRTTRRMAALNPLFQLFQKRHPTKRNVIVRRRNLNQVLLHQVGDHR